MSSPRRYLRKQRATPHAQGWLAEATKGRQLIARRVIPISTEEFHSPTHRPAYSVLSNSRLTQAFGVSLPDWRAQLKRCFVFDSTPANSAAGCGAK